MHKKVKQINRFGNLRLIGVIMKVAYSFLIVGYLRTEVSYLDEVYSIAGFLCCFELTWLLVLPMNITK